MTLDRFTWQKQQALSVKGRVLNLGCNDDPAGLGALPNVVNVDIRDRDPAGYPNAAHEVWDCTDKWPCVVESDLVILGDIVEHMYPGEFADCLAECYKWSKAVAITVPKDTRILEDPDYYGKVADQPKGHVHVTVWEEHELHTALIEAGFGITESRRVNYGFVPEGWFIRGERDVGSSLRAVPDCGDAAGKDGE